MFYALYELTFVALAHSSEVFVLPQLAVGHAEISTGHAESWGRKIAAAVGDSARVSPTLHGGLLLHHAPSPVSQGSIGHLKERI